MNQLFQMMSFYTQASFKELLGEWFSLKEAQLYGAVNTSYCSLWPRSGRGNPPHGSKLSVRAGLAAGAGRHLLSGPRSRDLQAHAQPR